MIKIKTKKKVNHATGIVGRVIQKIEALEMRQLPTKYLDGNGPCVYKCIQSDSYTFLMGNHKSGFRYKLIEGYWYSEEDFQKELEYIKAAGENLHRVNKELNKIRKKWGEGRIETFKI